MISEESRNKIIDFFENISKYYGCKTEITEGLYTDNGNLEAEQTTWNLSEFTLVRSAYRNNGARLMMEGEKMYYEISASIIIDFKQPGRNSFEFVEQYGQTVFRITKIRFHYRY
ncbi:hypothetical protein HYN48_14890 [Flavobacterium magnum]|uniref:Uncharacterized protein n=1 Tax=Flavobacterium magnum TaxID=2162713 RepID=A0A2S0RI22_9FLAO|nr:hypothetical protein [Flavobacterium magnum]AWA31275.1 hypothetical protein HYN48_14890 [Flavobacterium magnum]